MFNEKTHSFYGHFQWLCQSLQEGTYQVTALRSKLDTTKPQQGNIHRLYIVILEWIEYGTCEKTLAKMRIYAKILHSLDFGITTYSFLWLNSLRNECVRSICSPNVRILLISSFKKSLLMSNCPLYGYMQIPISQPGCFWSKGCFCWSNKSPPAYQSSRFLIEAPLKPRPNLTKKQRSCHRNLH